MLTSASDAIVVNGQGYLRSNAFSPALAALDASRMIVSSGAFVNVAGASALNVAGSLVSLSNGAMLSILNGPLLSLSGGSFANLGSLVTFGGTGGNVLSVTNSLCGGPCMLIGGIPVALMNGATLANVSLGAGAIKNPGLGTITYASPNTALISVSGPATKLTVGGKSGGS